MLQPSRKVRTLRSSDLDHLNVPRVRTAVGSRAFSVAAHRLWNDLPLEIRSAKTQISFRKKLKTYFWSGFFDLNPRWSGWPRRQTQTVFGIMSRITNMFVAPLCSDHRRLRRSRSLLLKLLLLLLLIATAAVPSLNLLVDRRINGRMNLASQ